MKKKLIHLALVASIVLLIFTYYGYKDTSEILESSNDLNIIEVKAEVLTTENEEVMSALLTNIGFQEMTVKILNGSHKGEVFQTTNSLQGQIDMDTLYKEGDTILMALQIKEGKIVNTVPLELYRQNWMLILFLFFVLTLILYAGLIGINALLSFLLSVIVLWEVFIKGLLAGKNPLMLTTLTVVILSAIIIFLVAGITKKGISAFISTIFGLLVTLVLTHFFGGKIAMQGLTQAYVNTLVVSGYYNLDVQQIFYAAVVLGASGAAMDISMDIATSMSEVKDKKPDIGLKELVDSGFNVGRHVIGTMSTTLLLAYSGSYLTLLMLFQVKNASFIRMINLKMVSAEIMRTLIGSIGLILVAPLTAIVTGVILTRRFSISKESVEEELVSDLKKKTYIV